MATLRTQLEGSLVRLEPLAPEHAPMLWEAAQDRRIWEWTTHIADRREDFDAWLDSSLAQNPEEKTTFATVLRTTGSAVGSTSFHRYRPNDGVVEVGSTWLNPSLWGTGVNVEAKLLMLEHAFTALGCVRVEFKTDARNERSRAALAAIPAQFEGVLRKQINISGVGVRDSAFFSVIDDEWPEVRARLEARLPDHLA
jgi:RimJ/RimL family protein N-acetyltransferase